VLPDHPEVVIKPMFGNLGAFVNGNMFAGLFGPTIGVKLGEADKQMLESSERTVPFAPTERPMGGYTGLPGSGMPRATAMRRGAGRAGHELLAHHGRRRTSVAGTARNALAGRGRTGGTHFA
jgi:hypothetical protein